MVDQVQNRWPEILDPQCVDPQTGEWLSRSKVGAPRFFVDRIHNRTLRLKITRSVEPQSVDTQTGEWLTRFKIVWPAILNPQRVDTQSVDPQTEERLARSKIGGQRFETR